MKNPIVITTLIIALGFFPYATDCLAKTPDQPVKPELVASKPSKLSKKHIGLEELNKKYADKGLKVLGFPCNQFGHQEPGDSSQIGAFCQKNYGVDFQMFEKVDVNGKDAHPLYKYLTSSAPGILGTEAIKWNFTKFLVDRQGKVVKRYGSDVEPKDISSDIEKQLEKN